MASEPAEVLGGQGAFGEGGEYVSGVGAGDGQQPKVAGDVSDGDVFVGVYLVAEQVKVAALAGDARVEVEPVVAEAGDGDFGFDAAVGSE